MRGHGVPVNRFYSIDGGRLFKMTSHRSLQNWRQDGTDRHKVGHTDRNTGEWHYSRDFIVEICHVHYSHCFDSTKELNGLLDRAGISRARYYQLRHYYNIQIQTFVQVDGRAILPVYK
ncbi:hypothetical protein CRM76_01155 [Edwardsiella tarda]|uniref:Uncharacterized protein n=1 Tax=Edwardsiella tarda TaxID=636 RepID=A0A2A7U7K2_EDWTA|nr:hypothetical protein CRM76_01155 [Edwardsiella tarda]